MEKNFNNQPLVSIVMNCYNGENYLHKSIQSVLAQTYKKWELIFWDNRSSDKSAEIFKSYKDSRFKYFYAPKHTLLYEARNEAIKKSKGEFIAFLDTDDTWEKNKLEVQMPLFNNSEVAVVYGNYFIINEKLNRKRVFLKKKIKGFILDHLLKKYIIGLVTIILRKNFLDNPQSPFDNQYHIIGDFDLIIRLSAKYKFDYSDHIVASYRVHKKNESLLNKDRHLQELKIWQKEMLKISNICKNKNFSNINKTINSLEIINLIIKNDKKKARDLIYKMPYSYKKIKYLVASILPISLIKRFIEF
jgi:glycosyltransferase involved in cell wall biosynthesis